MRDLLTFLGIFILMTACQQDKDKTTVSPTPFLRTETAGVDSLLAQMSMEEKVGQLLLFQSDLSTDSLKDQLFQQLHHGALGGLLLEQLPLHDFIGILDTARHITNIPLMVATREEVLLNNQFADVLPLPARATVRSAMNDSLQQRLWELSARQARQLGVNLSLSTVFDDSYTNQIENLNQHRILAGVKAIPAGAILKKVEAACQWEPASEPLTAYTTKGASVLYLQDFAYDFCSSVPLSILPHYIRRTMEFEGLLLAEEEPGLSALDLLKAGTDMVVVQNNLAGAFEAIVEAVEEGKLSISDLDKKVRRILLAKKWAKTRTDKRVRPQVEQPKVLQASFKSNALEKMPAALLEPEALTSHFKDEKWDLLRYRIYKKSMVVLGNKNDLLPFKSLNNRRFRIVSYGPDHLRTFQKYFDKYADTERYHFGPESPDVLSILRPSRSEGKTTVITLEEIALKPARDTAFIQALKDLAEQSEVVIVNFGEAQNFQAFDTSMTLVQIHERNDMTESLAAQLLFGAIATTGQLSRSINDYFPEGHGIKLMPIRLKYGIPEEVGIAPEKLVGIDAIVKTAIDDGAMPGCQVLVAKDGNVIYSKAFGHHTFVKKRPVKTSDLYDLASITKVAATTLTTMQLYEQQKLALDDRLQELLDWDGRSTIKYISLKKLLTHHSGLQPNMPIAPYIMYRDVHNTGCDSFFCNTYSDTFSIRVADNFYFDKRQVDQIWEKIHSLRVGSQRRYRYSDVNFVLVQKVVETITKQGLDKRVEEAFYRPLGLRRNLFNPTDRFSVDEIVPTQNDYRWRHQLVQGYVHDESAALLGGVAGNAGLFSNAEDLAVPFQMLLNGGTYGGERFLKPETVDLFTKTHTSSRRGLGFYKPFQDSDYTPGPSAKTFGHTGFTGTAVWADPDNNLLYIFLANRIHPSIRNRAWSQSRVRKRVHQVVYDALDTYKFEMPDLPLTPEEEGNIKG